MNRDFENLDEAAVAALGEKLAGALFSGAFIALTGELGAGKTTFTRGVGRGLGIDDIASPTFTIVREHKGRLPLYHFDAYRLFDENELYDMGFADYLARPGVIVMEWSENVTRALPNKRLDIAVCGCGEAPRTLRFTARSAEYEKLLEAL